MKRWCPTCKRPVHPVPPPSATARSVAFTALSQKLPTWPPDSVHDLILAPHEAAPSLPDFATVTGLPQPLAAALWGPS